MDLSVKLSGLNLKNPIIPASGCFGYGKEFTEFYDLSTLGGIVLKSTTPAYRFGNPLPRIAEGASLMMNAIGLQNPGIDYVLEKELPYLEKVDTEVIASVAGSCEEDYVEVIQKFNTSTVPKAYELNISCPNVKCGGQALGIDPAMVQNVVSMCKEVANKPVYVKLSPNVTDITAIARAAEKAGADGLSMINCLTGMRLDLKTGRPIIANGTGGMSGPAIKPLAIRMIYEVAQVVNIPILGIGGITSSEDVLEFLYAGASAVQVGAYNFVDPYACPNIIKELPATLEKYGFKSVTEAIGFAHR